MLRVKFFFEHITNIEEEVNKFLKQCDKQGFVVRNITYICVRETRYHVFVEYEERSIKG